MRMYARSKDVFFALQVLAADSVSLPQEPRDTGTVFGTLQLPPQTVYRCSNHVPGCLGCTCGALAKSGALTCSMVHVQVHIPDKGPARTPGGHRQGRQGE